MRKSHSEELDGTELDVELLFQNVGHGHGYRSVGFVNVRFFLLDIRQ